MKDTAVFLCDQSGVMAEPWAAAGIECYCVDIEPGHGAGIRTPKRRGNIHFVWGDARSWLPPDRSRIVFLAAFPPCTDVSGAGARDWLMKGHYLLSDALELWSACMLAGAYSGAPYMVENPVGAISRHMRAPDYTFHPCDYAGYARDPSAEAYTKKTCLWTGGGFIMPDRRPVEPKLGSKMWRLPPGEDRQRIRAVTPGGFAHAVFRANCSEQESEAVA